MATRNRARDAAEAEAPVVPSQAARTEDKILRAARSADSVEDSVGYMPEDEVLAAADRIAEQDQDLLRRLAQ